MSGQDLPQLPLFHVVWQCNFVPALTGSLVFAR